MRTELTNSKFSQAWEQLEISNIVDGNAEYTVTLGKSWAVSYKIKYPLTMQLRNLTPRYILKRKENVCSHKICV